MYVIYNLTDLTENCLPNNWRNWLDCRLQRTILELNIFLARRAAHTYPYSVQIQWCSQNFFFIYIFYRAQLYVAGWISTKAERRRYSIQYVTSCMCVIHIFSSLSVRRMQLKLLFALSPSMALAKIIDREREKGGERESRYIILLCPLKIYTHGKSNLLHVMHELLESSNTTMVNSIFRGIYT